MSDWSVTRENIVIAAGGEAVKKRFTQFLIGLQSAPVWKAAILMY